LPLAAQVHVSQFKDDFAQVNGLGFVWREHLATPDHAEDDFVNVAERFLHAPYLWGGKTISGLDCSGLVQIALQACNSLAPRDTDMMEGSLGSALPLHSDLSGLRRGDLVFWKGHVGIMIDASQLLHANGTFMQVTREPLSVARERIRSKTGGDITSLRRL
jgi:cell wall-associated NlpC family hydrolase